MSERAGSRGETPPRVPLAPRPTRAGRLLVYFRRMLPLPVLVASAVAHWAAVDLGAQALAGHAPLIVTWRAVPVSLVVALLTLLLRVQDELKDAEGDRALARAGDPRYVGRPVVTGEVREDDLRLLRRLAVVLVLVAATPLAQPRSLSALALALVLILLSGEWFYWPAIRKSLVLAFITHNPLSLAISLYVLAVSNDGSPIRPDHVDAATLLVGLWAPVAAWETSRKVRLPADETDYVTWSRVLGWRTAALVPAGFVLLSFALLARAAHVAGLGPGFLAALAAAAALPVGACVRLRVAPRRDRADLRPFAEVYAIVAALGFALACALRHGVTLA